MNSAIIPKLTDFASSTVGFGNAVIVVGVGSAGCRMASQFSKESKRIDRYLFISCDEYDLYKVNTGTKILVEAGLDATSSPFAVRGFAIAKLAEITNNIAGSRAALVFVGAGGAVGTALGPMVAGIAADHDVKVISVVAMPTKAEKSKYFHAQCTLKWLSRYGAVLKVDNDYLLDQRMPLIDGYAHFNQEIALILGRLFAAIENIETFDFEKAFLELSLGPSRDPFFDDNANSKTDVEEKEATYATVKQFHMQLVMTKQGVEGSVLQSKLQSFDAVDAILGPRNNLDDTFDIGLSLRLSLQNIEQ